MQEEPQAGAHERRLAVGAIAQQGSQVVGTLVMLAVITVVARSLSLSEFGVYGLTISFTTYLLIAQTSVEGAAVKSLGGALDPTARDRAFSIALVVYSGLGLIAAVLVGLGGALLIGVFDIPRELVHQARLGLVAIGIVMAVGWPMKTFQDALRGSQQFVRAAVAEILAYVTFGVATLVLVGGDAPLWILIALGGALAPMMGLFSAVLFVFGRLQHRLRVHLLERHAVREFLGLSGNLFALGIADLVIYSLDRTVLAAFRPASTVGLYEGPVRVHNLVRQVNGTLVLTVLPAASRYIEEGDSVRVRDLLLRGTRYVVAVVVPVTIVLMALAEPILVVWLGERFAGAATAMTILLSYWLVASTNTVSGPMLIAAGRARALVWYAAGSAALNLGLSLALTPSLGLEGVTLGTAIPYFVLAPVLFAITLSEFDVEIRDFWHEVWLPAFGLAVPLAGALIALRLLVDVDTLPEVVGAAVAALGLYWGAFYAFCLRPSERTLIRSLVPGSSTVAPR